MKEKTADSIVASMQTDSGIITRSDLEQYHAILREPLRGRYRGFEVLTAPPSSSGGVALLQLLQIIEGFGISHEGRTAHDVHLHDRGDAPCVCRPYVLVG